MNEPAKAGLAPGLLDTPTANKLCTSVLTAGGVVVCAAGGALFAWLGTPLPWMMGSIVAMAAAQMLGARLEAPRGGLNL